MESTAKEKRQQQPVSRRLEFHGVVRCPTRIRSPTKAVRRRTIRRRWPLRFKRLARFSLLVPWHSYLTREPEIV